MCTPDAEQGACGISKRYLIVGSVVLAMAVSAACGNPPSGDAPVSDTQSPVVTSEAAVTVEPMAPVDGQIEWTLCDLGLECGFVEVPADYRHAEAGSVRVAVNVHRATSPERRIVWR